MPTDDDELCCSEEFMYMADPGGVAHSPGQLISHGGNWVCYGGGAPLCYTPDELDFDIRYV